ncbi:hypothetical protein [Haloplanus halophilus]|uniref:hypothetical protein n=1 Tax=Haloplanus halophilus TaxID=2949993 RepID=UPI00203CF22C|nr:hypothetical protein [Haloplanus sp. GDY1]
MERRTLRTVAVVLLVVVAGCAGFASDEDTSPTDTPTAAVTATPTETAAPTPTTPEPERATYPAGWTDAGVGNTTLALDTHYRAVLAGPSATVRYRSREVGSEEGPGNETTLGMTYDTETERLYASLNGSDDHREVFFADGTLSRWSVRNETVVGRSSARFDRVVQSVDRRVLLSQLLLYRLDHDRTVERNGTTAFVYDVTGVYENALSHTYGSAEAGSGRVVVAESGRVLEVDTTVRYTGGNVTYTYTQTRLGSTTVDTPAWAQRE